MLGEGKRDVRLQCHQGFINVTGNLKVALVRLRYRDAPRNLWIDTICINQDDLKERSAQVQLMGEIYKRASRVLIWLGEEDSGTAAAYDTMKCLKERVFNLDKERNDSVAKLPSKIEACKSLGIPLPNSSELYAVERLFQRPWFYRAWIYQESILAQTTVVITGSHWIPGIWIPAVVMGILDLDRMFPVEPDYFVGPGTANAFSIFLPWAQMQNRKLQASFWDKLSSLLIMRRGVKARDARDIIYSLIGAAADNATNLLRPDYSIPWYEVYISTARQLLAGVGRLDLLGETGNLKQPSLLPTWVPDWRNAPAGGEHQV